MLTGCRTQCGDLQKPLWPGEGKKYRLKSGYHMSDLNKQEVSDFVDEHKREDPDCIVAFTTSIGECSQTSCGLNVASPWCAVFVDLAVGQVAVSTMASYSIPGLHEPVHGLQPWSFQPNLWVYLPLTKHMWRVCLKCIVGVGGHQEYIHFMEAESEESEPEPESVPRRRRDKTHDAEGEVYAEDTSDEEEMRREVVHAQQRRNELIAESLELQSECRMFLHNALTVEC